MRIKKTGFDSLKTGKLSNGCKQCVKGEKSVFFITGLCPRRCTYCPISDAKKDKDVTYINEWEIKNEKDVISEIKLCGSKGVGITGGDPLVTIQRTADYIKLLKDTFGKKFHIHLYTSLDLVNKDYLNKLYEAGLDEIRFHPDFNKETQWERLKLASIYDWKIVIEIPAIPKDLEKIKKLLDKTSKYIDYLNLNELEVADNSFSKTGKEYETIDDVSYAVKGSKETALEIMEYANKLGISNVHFCTAKLKDSHQLAKRIKKRAKNVKLKTDKLTREGMLIRGAVYFKELQHKKVTKSDIEKAKKIYDLMVSLGVKEKKLFLDEDFARVITTPKILKKHLDELKKKKYKAYIIEEYPTKDAFPIEIEEL
ncbi:radical SAM protein [Candidatus Woesearchaeota archaeon]|nr:MAG: radical SAM protein [Candidatus Woesearchaeota archaeon]